MDEAAPDNQTEGRLRGPIQIGDVVRSKSSGRLYKVNPGMVPANAYRRSHSVYDVTDLDTGMVNAFDGSEIEKLNKADAAKALER